MEKKAVSGIMLTLLLTSVLSFAFNTQRVKAGTIIVPDHYPTIQSAINGATSGDTIYVRAGTYYEHVVVNKTVLLIGENGESTIIDGGKTGNVVYVTSNHVVINQFTIQNSDEWGSGISIGYLTINVTIQNNNITKNGDGIYLLGSGHTLRNNHMSNNQRNLVVPGWDPSQFAHDIDSSNIVDGKRVYYWVSRKNAVVPADAGYVALVNSYNITAKGLELKNNYPGILLANTTNSQIINNSVNGEDINVYWSSENIIRGNEMMNAGINLGNSSYHDVFDNSITSATERTLGGISLYGSYNNIYNNSINITAPHVEVGGIYLAGSYNNVSSNTVTVQNSWGIMLLGSNNVLRGNNMTDSWFNFGLGWRQTQNLTDYVNDVDTSNTVDGKPVYYWVNKGDMSIPLGAGYVALINCTNIRIQNLNLKNNLEGVFLAFSEETTIAQNMLTNNWDSISLFNSSNNDIYENTIIGGRIEISHSSHNYVYYNTVTNGIIELAYSSNNSVYSNVVTYGWSGLNLDFSSNNNVYDNTIINNSDGIRLFYSSNNTLSGNTVKNNSLSTYSDGIYLSYSSDNLIFHNDFINNTNQAYSHKSLNLWDDGYPSGGNYWSDYTGVDTNGDDIGDTPYVIDENNTDWYPLMNPWTSIPPTPDFSITASPTSLIIQQGDSDTSTITIMSIAGFDQPIQLTATGAPSGVTTTLSPDQATPPPGASATSTLTVSVETTATVGRYTLTVTGTSGSLTRSADISLEIRPVTEPVISARIDSYNPNDPNNPLKVKVGDSVTISATFTNTGTESWKFIAGATLWDSSGAQVANYEKTLDYYLNPGQQTTVSWTHTVDSTGDFWLQFGLWKAKPFNAENLLDKKPSPSKRLIVGSPEEPPPTDQAPVCVIKLQRDGIEISEIDVGEFFDIYVGKSTDDTGIAQVRFSSDDLQDDIPTGEWTEWYNWGVSSEDWNAESKIKRWAFATPGYKEVWAEVKDNVGQTVASSAYLFVPAPALPAIISPLVITPLKEIYNAGDTLTAEFTIKNIGEVPITLDVLTVGGRLNGWRVVDFTHQSVKLQPAMSYQYQGTLTLTQQGSYRFFVAFYVENPTQKEKTLLDENNWNTRVELGEGLTHTDRVKNIIVYEEGIVPEEVSQVNKTINRLIELGVEYPTYLLDPEEIGWVASVWMTVSSVWTDVQEEYDTLYFAGVDYGYLKIKALLLARSRLEIGDIEGARKFLRMAYTFGEQSYRSFLAATELLDRNLEVAEDIARTVKDLCQATVVAGVSVINPTAGKVLDYTFIITDYFINEKLVGEEQALRTAVRDAIVTTAFNEVPFFDGKTMSEYVKVDPALKFTEMQRYIKNSKVLPEELYDAIKELGVEGAEDLSKAISDALSSGIDYILEKERSPIVLRLYDSTGRITGLIHGEIRHEIPTSIYYDGTITIFFPFDTYYHEVAGTETGTYGLDIVLVKEGETTTFTAIGIPTSANAIHQYTIDWEAISAGEEGVTVKVDSDGDGAFEKTFNAGSKLTQDEFLQQVSPVQAFPMWIVGVAIVIVAIAILAIAVFRRKRKNPPQKDKQN